MWSLFSDYFWWLVLALLIGVAVGWFTCNPDRARS
jgi:hypothetical protein